MSATVKVCRAWLVGASPYSQSAMVDQDQKKDREGYDAFEARIWREKCTVNGEGIVVVPSMAFKQALDTTAQKLGVKIPGRRGSTYKTFFASGFSSNRDVPIGKAFELDPKTGRPNPDFEGYTKMQAKGLTINANSDGVRGSGKRVKRTYPEFFPWRGVAEFLIVDPIITEAVFAEHLTASGVIVGIGRFRPSNGGHYGRYVVDAIKWEERGMDSMGLAA